MLCTTDICIKHLQGVSKSNNCCRCCNSDINCCNTRQQFLCIWESIEYGRQEHPNDYGRNDITCRIEYFLVKEDIVPCALCLACDFQNHRNKDFPAYKSYDECQQDCKQRKREMSENNRPLGSCPPS